MFLNSHLPFSRNLGYSRADLDMTLAQTLKIGGEGLELLSVDEVKFEGQGS